MRAEFRRFTRGNFRRLDGSDALDLAVARFLLGHDAIDGDLLFLRDTGGLHDLARGNFCLFNRLGAGDVEGANPFLLGNTRRRSHFARLNVGLLQRARALDFQSSGCDLCRDAFSGERLFPGNARGFRRPSGSNLFLLDRAVARDLAAPDFFFECDPFVGDDALLGDTGAFGGLAGGDFRLFEVSGPFDFEPPVLLVHGNAGARDRQFLGNARFLRFLARCNLGVLDVALTLDFAALIILLARNARLGNYPFLGDARALDPFAGRDFGFIELAAALDFAFTDFPLGDDPCFRNRPLMRYARFLDLFASGNLRLLGLGIPQRTLAGEFGALYRAANLDVALLIEAGAFAFAVYIECLFLCFEIAAANEDHRVPARCRCAACGGLQCPRLIWSNLRRQTGSTD